MFKFIKKEPQLILAITFLLLISYLVLRSIAPFVFPSYFIYFVLAISAFLLFSQIEFDVLAIFYWQFYILSIVLLIIPLLIGQITRGAVRWIPLGPITLQPSEIVRPFLLIFFAVFLTQKNPDLRRFVKALILLSLPLFLILIQPSLGVTVLTALGFLGVVFASTFSKKTLILLFGLIIVSLPVVWLLLAPYQRERVNTFLSPQLDPMGAGYNSLQSMISVGSGKLWGRGLGEGVQTQLSFLPERHTDFIFASVSEELGFVGAIFLLSGSMFLLWRVIELTKYCKSVSARAFITGIFLTLFAQTMVHVGMNMGMLPITGVPLPLVSAGGSSLLSTMIALGMVVGTKRKI